MDVHICALFCLFPSNIVILLKCKQRKFRDYLPLVLGRLRISFAVTHTHLLLDNITSSKTFNEFIFICRNNKNLKIPCVFPCASAQVWTQQIAFTLLNSINITILFQLTTLITNTTYLSSNLLQNYLTSRLKNLNPTC